MYFNFKIYILNTKSFSMKLILKNDLIHEFSNQWSHSRLNFLTLDAYKYVTLPEIKFDGNEKYKI